MKKISFDKNKNSKIPYYLLNIARLLIPGIIHRLQLKCLLNQQYDVEYINNRLNYYNKVQNDFLIPSTAKTLSAFKKEDKKTYFFDLIEYFRYFPCHYKVLYLFGDITEIPENPSFVKSRPISGDNQNSVLMKLDKVRHFIFVNDEKKFEDKKNIAVWRGVAHRPHRVELVKRYHNDPICNVGQTNKRGDLNVPWQKEKMSLQEQLDYKYILSPEGIDVASNLKWIMSSNSLAFMPKPKYETWFMEGTLIPNHHYVLLKDDYSDLEEKILYFSNHIDEALKIIQNAHDYIDQFRDNKREDLLSLLVVNKFFQQSNQI